MELMSLISVNVFTHTWTVRNKTMWCETLSLAVAHSARRYIFHCERYSANSFFMFVWNEGNLTFGLVCSANAPAEGLAVTIQTCLEPQTPYELAVCWAPPVSPPHHQISHFLTCWKKSQQHRWSSKTEPTPCRCFCNRLFAVKLGKKLSPASPTSLPVV